MYVEVGEMEGQALEFVFAYVDGRGRVDYVRGKVVDHGGGCW